ncbi:hypothetical protein AN478_00335 [Thiohalorhabdus denitrificans]|uniref:Bifunctional DNase/RNase n=1 Tax=Thiohalorhabdus denitrificans TaxID=381306 RepID=A0A0P9ET27_9GAMM|nr:bifunctional nuclease domain-containing protein [Thiohalorhabdus denitrificans]KPV41882.1 hypothetical protein AN478_00335 [Thiohalorhabdus denitrificans]SCY65361.1 Bifunctional DNase/RNase [Thiohalorhabdus denitrificans]
MAHRGKLTVRPGLWGLLLGAALLLAANHTAAARELAADEDRFVEVEAVGVGVTPAGAPAVLLRRPGAGKAVPIFVDAGQAQAIAMALQEVEPSRPMTHDLLRDTLGALEAELRRIYVDDVRDGAFYGMLELAVAGREAPVRVDSRPSDALALALRAGVPILAAPKVLEAAREVEYRGMEERIARAAGITVNPLTEELRRALELPDRKGVVVSAAIGPAHHAGLRPGALITAINGETPRGPAHFRALLRETPSGERAEVTFWQEGEEHRIEIPPELSGGHRARRAPRRPEPHG